ncbi:MAG: hypothetical protein WAV28_18270 [Sedimentisphaerales bacterium]
MNRFLRFGLLRSPTVEMTNTLHTSDSKPKTNDPPGDRCDIIPSSHRAATGSQARRRPPPERATLTSFDKALNEPLELPRGEQRPRGRPQSGC